MRPHKLTISAFGPYAGQTEIDFDKVTIRGLDVVIVTTAKSDKEAYSLLEMMGMPFKR